MSVKREGVIPIREKMKDIWGLFFVLCSLFIFVSLATYDPADIAGVKYPANSPVVNKGGSIGAAIAHFLYHNFGIASFVLVILTGLWAVQIFFRRRLDAIYLKVIAAFVTTLGCATFASMQSIVGLHHVGLDGSAPGAGGVYGKALELFLARNLGYVGAYMCVILSVCASVVLATDWLIYVGVIKAYNFLRDLYNRRSPRRGRPQPTAERQPELAVMEPQPSLDERFKAIVENKATKVAPAAVPSHATPVMADNDPIAPTVQAHSPAVKEPPRKPAAVAGPYEHPPLDLFEDKIERIHQMNDKDVKERMVTIESTLRNFDVEARVVNYESGPTITIYELELAPGTRYQKLVSLADDLAISLKAPNVRVIAPMPGKSTVGVEVPNPYPDIVRVKEFMGNGYGDLKKIPLPLLLGKTNSGAPIIKSLTEMPHLLVAGTTGSGKSVCLNSVITSMISVMSPEEMKLILIDPKMVELSAFKDIPHLWSPVVTDMKKAPCILDWLAKEMDERYNLLSMAQVRKIDSYNQLGEKKLIERMAKSGEVPEDVPTTIPYIVLVIDELADLMMMSGREVENSITRIAQKSRAVGIHLILATQRPSVDVITGLIKSNMPARIAFKVASKIDSRTILDQSGAERLLGKGDMLMILPGLFAPVRAQCSYVSDEEIRAIVGFLKAKGAPEYHQELVEIDTDLDFEGTDQDELFDEAVRIVLESQRGSVSLLQRKLGVGYSRAARLVDNMAKLGVVGEYKGSNARDVIMTLDQWEAAKAKVAGAE